MISQRGIEQADRRANPGSFAIEFDRRPGWNIEQTGADLPPFRMPLSEETSKSVDISTHTH